MRVRFVSVLIVLTTLASCGSPNNAAIKLAAKAKVQALNDATIGGDYDKVADLTHPKIIQMAGCRDKLIDIIENSMEEMKQKGIVLESSKVGEPSEIVKQGDEIYIIVPFDLTMKFRDGMRTSSAYVIGVSTDEGKKWAFVNASSGDNIKEILPNLPEKLKLPGVKKPAIEKE
jgi:hypothetical protein